MLCVADRNDIDGDVAECRGDVAGILLAPAVVGDVGQQKHSGERLVLSLAVEFLEDCCDVGGGRPPLPFVIPSEVALQRTVGTGRIGQGRDGLGKRVELHDSLVLQRGKRGLVQLSQEAGDPLESRLRLNIGE